MKKMVRQNGDISFNAESANNAISFSAVKEVGPTSVGFPTVVARIDNHGKITCEDIDDFSKERNNFHKVFAKMGRKHSKRFLIIGMIFLLISIPIGIIDNRLSNVTVGLFMLSIGCSMAPGSIGFFVEKLKGNKEVINVMKFHAAEHAAINAYYDLNRVPTLEEIREYSNFSYNCGSLAELRPLFIMMVVAISRMIFPSPITIIVYFICTLLLLFWSRKIKPYFLEFLVTQNPTDREYLVAIAGIERAVSVIEEVEIELKFMQDLIEKERSRDYS